MHHGFTLLDEGYHSYGSEGRVPQINIIDDFQKSEDPLHRDKVEVVEVSP